MFEVSLQLLVDTRRVIWLFSLDYHRGMLDLNLLKKFYILEHLII